MTFNKISITFEKQNNNNNFKQKTTMETFKTYFKAITGYIFSLLILMSLLGNIAQYMQCKAHIDTIIYLQKEIQYQQDVTIRVLDKVTDKVGGRTIKN